MKRQGQWAVLLLLRTGGCGGFPPAHLLKLSQFASYRNAYFLGLIETALRFPFVSLPLTIIAMIPNFC